MGTVVEIPLNASSKVILSGYSVYFLLVESLTILDVPLFIYVSIISLK